MAHSNIWSLDKYVQDGQDQNSICKEIQEQRPITIQLSNNDFTAVD